MATPLIANAGSSMRSGGEGFVSMNLAMDMGKRIFDKQGNAFSGSCSPGQSVGGYGEYGWSYYTTVFVSGALKQQRCPGGEKLGLQSGKVGISRRIIPTSNAWVWEAAVLLPTRNLGAGSTSRDALGMDLGLNYHRRADPYDLSRETSFLEPQWDAGASLKIWANNLPREGNVYVRYSHPIRVSNWNTGLGGWTMTAQLDYSQTLGNTHASQTFAVDSQDAFRRLNVSLGVNHAIGLYDSLSLNLKTSLAGKNTDDSREINLSYEKTLPK